MSDPENPAQQPAAQPRICAYCNRRAVAADWHPFCSKGCADRDLLHWLGESYALPADSPLDSEGDEG